MHIQHHHIRVYYNPMPQISNFSTCWCGSLQLLPFKRSERTVKPPYIIIYFQRLYGRLFSSQILSNVKTYVHVCMQHVGFFVSQKPHIHTTRPVRLMSTQNIWWIYAYRTRIFSNSSSHIIYDVHVRFPYIHNTRAIHDCFLSACLPLIPPRLYVLFLSSCHTLSIEVRLSLRIYR